MEQPFFLVPQNEDDSMIDKWDITNDDIVAVLTTYGLKNTDTLTIDWVLSSEIPHFALRNISKHDAKVLQSLCELEGIELSSGHLVTVDNALYCSSTTPVVSQNNNANDDDDEEIASPKKEEEEEEEVVIDDNNNNSDNTDNTDNNTDNIEIIANDLTEIIEAKKLDDLVEFCSHADPHKLKESHVLQAAVVLALVYQLSLCLPSPSDHVTAWIEVFTEPAYIQSFGAKVVTVFCDVVVPVLSKRIAHSSPRKPEVVAISSNMKALVAANADPIHPQDN